MKLSKILIQILSYVKKFKFMCYEIVFLKYYWDLFQKLWKTFYVVKYSFPLKTRWSKKIFSSFFWLSVLSVLSKVFLEI